MTAIRSKMEKIYTSREYIQNILKLRSEYQL